jgi:hypothetical protein
MVVIGGIASAIIIGLIKVGEIIVKRRTDALIASQQDATDRDDEAEPRS